MTTMLCSWWRGWKARRPVLCNVGAVLEQVARAHHSTPVEVLLRQWLRGYDMLDNTLTPRPLAGCTCEDKRRPLQPEPKLPTPPNPKATWQRTDVRNADYDDV